MTRATSDSLTIGQAAALTGLHKNTIRAYVKQGRISAKVVRGKYGQEYRIHRAELVALAALIDPPIDQDESPAAETTLQNETSAAADTVTADPSHESQGLVGNISAEDPLAHTGTSDPASGVQANPDSTHNLSLDPLVGLMRQLQEENRNLAGQLGFVQAQLQQARETIRLLQAPVDMVDGDEGGAVETPVDQIAAAEEVGRLKAELEQAQRRVAEFEAATEELELERNAAVGETTQRPWWRFWS